MKKLRVSIVSKALFHLEISPGEELTVTLGCEIGMPKEYGERYVAVRGSRLDGRVGYHLEWETSALSDDSWLTVESFESANAGLLPPHIAASEFTPIPAPITCSFCDRDIGQVRHLIQGGLYAFICDACIEECAKVLREKEAP